MPDTQVDPPKRLGGRYRVLDELGRGGMGVVYRVEHEGTGSRYAAKVLAAKLHDDPMALRRFQQEVKAATRLGGKHVVQTIDADRDAELGYAPFLVMELLEGRDLRQELDDRGHLPTKEVVRWLTQLARALDDAHERGVVHRDLKPENLFLARQPDGSIRLKVLDFGLAKLAQSGTLTTTGAVGLTATGEILGTPRYMAPEQAYAPKSIGPEADRWAVGMIAFELLTGQPYFSGGVREILTGLQESQLDPPSELAPGVSTAFDAWFLRSCSTDLRGRFDSVREQVLSLAQALDIVSPGPSGRPLSAPTPARVVVTPAPTAAPTPTRHPIAPAPGALAPRPVSSVGRTSEPRSRLGLWAVLIVIAVVVGAATGALVMISTMGR